MVKLQIDNVLRDMFALLRRDLPLTLSVGGLFYFLPSFIFYGLVPQTFVEADIDSWARFRSLLVDGLLIPSLVIGTFGAIGSVMVIRIWFQERGATVGDAVRYAVALVPVVVALHIATNIAMIGGMMLFIIPGIFVSVRMMMAMALVADRLFASPVDAWRDCWALSRGHGGPIFILLLIAGMLTMLVAFALGIVDGSLAEAGRGTTMLLTATTNGLVGLFGGMLNAALAAAAYRQLRTPDLRRIFS